MIFSLGQVWADYKKEFGRLQRYFDALVGLCECQVARSGDQETQRRLLEVFGSGCMLSFHHVTVYVKFPVLAQGPHLGICKCHGNAASVSIWLHAAAEKR